MAVLYRETRDLRLHPIAIASAVPLFVVGAMGVWGAVVSDPLLTVSRSAAAIWGVVFLASGLAVLPFARYRVVLTPYALEVGYGPFAEVISLRQVTDLQLVEKTSGARLLGRLSSSDVTERHWGVGDKHAVAIDTSTGRHIVGSSRPRQLYEQVTAALALLEAGGSADQH